MFSHIVTMEYDSNVNMFNVAPAQVAPLVSGFRTVYESKNPKKLKLGQLHAQIFLAPLAKIWLAEPVGGLAGRICPRNLAT